MPTLAGVFPILATTFRDDGSLDLDSQLSLVRHLLAAGAHGLGLFGNASEGYALTAAERQAVLQAVVREVDGRVPLVVSSGHTGTAAAVELSRQAEDMGASGLMVLPPYLMKTDADGLLHYYSEVGSAVRIPVMVQDAPLMTQVVMPPALLARIAAEAPNVCYAKVEAPPTAPKTTAVRKASGGAVTVFGGLNGQFMIEEMQRGARGVMPGSDLTAQYVAIWSAMESGDVHEAWRVFTQALPLIRFELQPGLGVSAMKHNLKAQGIIASTFVRHPTSSLTPESLDELEFLREWVRSPVEA
ncbi:dihydrodipicolinate synthase family protein [uncultured Paludibaculum sp.]|uniref:dihydrodipicolinate synthase family protein n=1 Tax=uncultured Paludibaculum sp. TaxID=1765020 RepID=UPI002AAA68D6|nr:dihydrodipicolinate synthase family protein [uncultured Paludibaculum sp.]